MTGTNAASDLKQASECLDKGDLQAAADLYNIILRTDPDNHEANLMLGSVYGEMGRLPEAVGLLQKAMHLKQDDPAAGLVLAHLYRAVGDSSKAIETLEPLAASIEDAEVNYTLATLEEEAGNREYAQRLLEKAIELSPDDPNAWLGLASLQLNAGEYTDAENSYQKVLRYEPGNRIATGFLSVVLTQLGRTDEAEQLLQKALAANATDPDMYYYLATLQQHQGMDTKALESCEQALALAPHDRRHTIKKAEILEGMGDLDRAFDLLKPVIDSGDIPVDAALTFARLSHPLGMIDDGKQVLQRLSRKPLPPVHRQNINDALNWLETV